MLWDFISRSAGFIFILRRVMTSYALHAALTTIEEMRQQGSQTDVYTGWRLKVVNGSGDVLLSLCLDGTALH
jgi:hypothetical protein